MKSSYIIMGSVILLQFVWALVPIPVMNQFVIASDPGADLTEPAGAYVSNGAGDSYLVSFVTSLNEIKIEQIATNGMIISGFTAASSTSNIRQTPSLAYDSTHNQFLVVWEETASGVSGILGRIFKPSGEAISDELILGIGEELTGRINPVVAYSSFDDQYLVAWQTSAGSGQPGDIEGEILSHTGTVLKGYFFIQQSSTVQKYSQPNVGYNSHSDEWLVVFQMVDSTSMIHSWNILGRRVSNNGSILDAPSGIKLAYENPGSKVSAPSIASYADPTGANCWVVVWTKLTGPMPQDDDIYQNFLKCDGTLVNVNGVGLSIGFTNDDFNPVISASLGGQRYLVSWMRSATNEITNCSRIVGQEETHSGEFIGAIHSLGDICSSHPTIVSGPKSDFLVIFDIGISPAKKEIRGSLLGYRMFFPLNVK